jgi:glucokinase
MYLGIEIGGTKLQLFVGAGREVQARSRFEVDPSKGGDGIRQQIERAIGPLTSSWSPSALGVGFGGPVDWQTGQICRSHQIAGWSNFELGPWLQRLTGKPVRVDNDANMGALGEASHGAGVGFDVVFYITLGSGVGGGLVVKGQIYHGAKPGEAEIGHVRLDRNGTTVESRCSGWAVDAKIRQLKSSGSSGRLAGLIGDSKGGEAKHLLRALQEKDRAAQLILEQTAQDLAFGLSHVVHLFHPDVIVLGGGLSLVGEPLRAAVAEALPAFVMDAFAGGPQIRLAALGEEAVPVGCLVAAEQLLAPGAS